MSSTLIRPWPKLTAVNFPEFDTILSSYIASDLKPNRRQSGSNVHPEIFGVHEE